MKKTIILIVGHGHSGSSIIGRLLNTIDNSVYVGECNQLYRYILKEIKCSCGEKIKDCLFWKSVLKDIKIEMLRINTKDIIKKNLLKKKLGNTKKLFENIFTRWPEFDTIIDSSKNPIRALLLIAFLRKNFRFEIVKTDRPIREIYKSYKKRANKKEKGRIASNLALFYVSFLYFQILFLVSLVFYKLFGINVKSLKPKNYQKFINENIDRLNVIQNSKTEYNLLEFNNHAIGGSFSSKNTLFRVE